MPLPVIGIIGSGRLGTAVARLSLNAGYDVLITNSRGPESLRLLVDVLLPGARAMTVSEVVTTADIIVLALPLRQYSAVPLELFDGKIVIDAMNYWPPTDGTIATLDAARQSSSEFIQSVMPAARIVKTLNHIAYNELEEDSRPSGSNGRRAVLMAGNHSQAKKTVGAYIDSLGFDAIDRGPLAAGKDYQPGTELFDSRFTSEELGQ